MTRTGAFGSVAVVVVATFVTVLVIVEVAARAVRGAGEDRYREYRYEERRELRAPAGDYARKLQSFCPTNESGVPATIAIACASTFITPASTSTTSTT